MENERKISNRQRMLAGLRRLRRPAQRRATWEFVPMYWSLRKRLRLLSFRILRRRHVLGDRARSSRESARIILLILRSVGGSILLAVLMVVASELAELAFRHFAHSTAVFASRWRILAAIYGSLKALRVDSGATASLLGTLASIPGVLLGFYFAVVG